MPLIFVIFSSDRAVLPKNSVGNQKGYAQFVFNLKLEQNKLGNNYKYDSPLFKVDQN